MAVADNATAVQTQRDPRQQLLLESALGAAYFLASLWVVFLGLPTLWRWIDLPKITNEFLADSLLFLATIPLVIGLIVLGLKLEGNNSAKGMRAGAFYLSASILISGLLITCGVALWVFAGVGLLIGAIVLFLQPSFATTLVNLDEQGWFHAWSFKPNQGLRVRRLTVLGLMTIAFCGVVTMVSHDILRTGSAWMVFKPFADTGAGAVDPWMVVPPIGEGYWVFMYRITLTMPILIFAAAGWFSWRLVNWPTFADFLIATEAEMNKVSWTTRKRLYQDTIVVLVTVVLFTLFLFLVDILWIKILTNPIIDVLKHDPQAAARKNQSGAQW